MPILTFYELSCDRCGDGYPASLSETGFLFALRRGATEAGWQLPPPRGKGSRSTPILCPTCKAAVS